MARTIRDFQICTPQGLKPLYEKLHAYVRNKLATQYPGKVGNAWLFNLILGISQNICKHLRNNPGLKIFWDGNPRLCHQYWWTILWMKIDRYSDLRFRYQDLSIDFPRFNLAVLCPHICSETCEFSNLKEKHLGFFGRSQTCKETLSFYSAGGLNSGATLATSWSLILANPTWMWPGQCSARFVSLSIVRMKIYPFELNLGQY